MTEPQLPSDPEDLLYFYMYMASAKTLTSVFDLLAEMQAFWIDEFWPVDSPEYRAVGDTLEAIKRLVGLKQNRMVSKANNLLG